MSLPYRWKVGIVYFDPESQTEKEIDVYIESNRPLSDEKVAEYADERARYLIPRYPLAKAGIMDASEIDLAVGDIQQIASPLQ